MSAASGESGALLPRTKELAAERDRLKAALEAAIVDLADCSTVFGRMNYPDTAKTTAEHVEAYKLALAAPPPTVPAGTWTFDEANRRIDAGGAPPGGLRPAREVAHELAGCDDDYQYAAEFVPRRHRSICDRITAAIERDRLARGKP